MLLTYIYSVHLLLTSNEKLRKLYVLSLSLFLCYITVHSSCNYSQLDNTHHTFFICVMSALSDVKHVRQDSN